MLGKLLFINNFVVFQDLSQALLHFKEGTGKFVFKLSSGKKAYFFLLGHSREANFVHFEKPLEILIRDFQPGTINHSFNYIIVSKYNIYSVVYY